MCHKELEKKQLKSQKYLPIKKERERSMRKHTVWIYNNGDLSRIWYKSGMLDTGNKHDFFFFLLSGHMLFSTCFYIGLNQAGNSNSMHLSLIKTNKSLKVKNIRVKKVKKEAFTFIYSCWRFSWRLLCETLIQIMHLKIWLKKKKESGLKSRCSDEQILKLYKTLNSVICTCTGLDCIWKQFLGMYTLQ